MKKFYIRYHIVGNRVVTDETEFTTLADAVTRTDEKLEREKIGIFKKSGHIIKLQTKYITFYEVMTEEEYDKMINMNRLGNLAKNALK